MKSSKSFKIDNKPWCVWCYKENHKFNECCAYRAEALTVKERTAARCADAYINYVLSSSGQPSFFAIDELQTFAPEVFELCLLQCDKKQQFSIIVCAFGEVFVFENVSLERPKTFSHKSMQLEHVLSHCVYRPFSKARHATDIAAAKAYLDAVSKCIRSD